MIDAVTARERSRAKEAVTAMQEAFGWITPADAPEENFLTGFAYQEYLAAKGAQAPLSSYTVSEYLRCYTFAAPIKQAQLWVSADTEFRLWGGKDSSALQFLATGPANPGGDFRCATMLRPVKYATELCYYPEKSHIGGEACAPQKDTNTLCLCALVKGMPVFLSEYSFGHTGLWMQGTVTLKDGTAVAIGTDATWSARLLPAYRRPFVYDDRFTPADFQPAVRLEMPVAAAVSRPQISPIPPRTEELISPEAQGNPENPAAIPWVMPGETRVFTFAFDKIYAAYPEIGVTFSAPTGTNSAASIRARFYETEEYGSVEKLYFSQTGRYTTLQLHSVGAAECTVTNHTTAPVQIALQLRATCYPVTCCAQTTTSDARLNELLTVCTHTLQYCRQQIHLDSPRHCEPLACTGDYYIQTLMTAFSFGDMRLARFDAIRTADILRQQNGEMFHTTYSLIWVLLLWDIYRFTGDTSLLAACEDALFLLLTRFEDYKGESGLPETPPSYMFVDWLFLDGLSLHHPPKALGQGCLAMFLYGALTAAQKIYTVLDNPTMVATLQKRTCDLRSAIRSHLWNAERQLFFAGLNTPTPTELLHDFLPQNTEKRYYLPHTNILAVLFGVAEGEEAAALLGKVCSGALGEVQPYFAHFLFEAIYRAGLRKRYTLPLAEKWYAPLAGCTKGLPEGFIPPEPGYSFDHSHAWGGSPLWSVPLALTGLQILQPGMRTLQFDFCLLGLEYATVQLPTPYGMVTCTLQRGKKAQVNAPAEISVQFDREAIL